MKANRLHPHDDVRIELYFNGKLEDAYQGSGYRTISEAINAAYSGSSRENLNIQDYVFDVADLTTGTSARYRVNAGGNITLLA